ncbi:hypothetical protein EON64_01760 [archaeon]|nr:MAG: hypothetical protein EON64_01760 [archaeon]
MAPTGLNLPQPRFRRRWTSAEDAQLRHAIETLGEGNWVTISKVSLIDLAGIIPSIFYSLIWS